MSTTLSRLYLTMLTALGVASLAGYLWLFAIAGGLGEGTPTYVERLLPGGNGLLPTSYPTPSNPSAQDATRRHAQAAPRFTVAITALFVVQALALLWAARARPNGNGRWLIVGFAAAFQASALLAPHMFSSDVYAYTVYGRILAVHGQSPYVAVPSAFPDEPFRALIFWQDVPSFYGPLWTLLSGGVALAAGPEPALAALLFRGVAALAALAGTLLVGAILDRVEPVHAPLGMLLFGWSPLLVVEAGLSGHNDVVMAALMLAALFAIVRERPLLGIALLVLAGLVKVVALAVLPLVGLYVLRGLPTWASRVAFLGRSAAVGAVVAALVVLPTWAGPATLAVGVLGVGESRYTNGLGELALRELRIAFGEEAEDTATPLLFTPWWVSTEGQTPLRAARGDDTPVIRTLSAESPLLVVAPQYGRWVRVYDPDSRRLGIVRLNAVGPRETRPAAFDHDPDILARELGPTGSPALQRANLIVRAAGWGLAGLVWLAVLVVGTRSWPGLIRGVTGFFLALLYLVSAWFWPWYVVWPLASAAIAPTSLLSVWAASLGWASLLLYPALGFGETPRDYLYSYRALAMFGLPMIVTLVVAMARRAWPGRASASFATGGPEDPSSLLDRPSVEPRPISSTHSGSHG
jgi:hypothetical protein